MHPTKQHFLPILVGDHLGMTLDFDKGEFRALNVKPKNIAALAKGLPCRATSERVALQSNLPQAPGEREGPCLSRGQGTILALGHSSGQVFLRELHDVVKSANNWSSTVKVSCQLKRDLEWWTRVPKHHNGAPI